MSLETALKTTITSEKEDDPIADIQCPPNFNMQSVITTGESLWRIAGYGVTPNERYLDDVVSTFVTTIHYY